MIHRQNNVLKTSSSKPDFAASYTVLACPVGAVASAASSGSTGTVDAGHGIAAGDKVLIYDGTTATFVAEAVNAVTGTTVVWSSATPTISKGDLLVNLGPDTASGSTPAYDASPMVIFTDADGSDAITNSLVTTNTQGKYGYYYRGDGRSWELIRDAGGGGGWLAGAGAGLGWAVGWGLGWRRMRSSVSGADLRREGQRHQSARGFRACSRSSATRQCVLLPKNVRHFVDDPFSDDGVRDPTDQSISRSNVSRNMNEIPAIVALSYANLTA